MTQILLVLAFGCRGAADVVDACDAFPSDSDAPVCHPCTSDPECRITGNPCTDVAYCAHVDDVIAIPDLGCSPALEYGWPPQEACACVDQSCRYEGR